MFLKNKKDQSMISEEALKQFKIIWQEEIGQEISNELLSEIALNLLMQTNNVYKPIKVEWLNEIEKQDAPEKSNSP